MANAEAKICADCCARRKSLENRKRGAGPVQVAASCCTSVNPLEDRGKSAWPRQSPGAASVRPLRTRIRSMRCLYGYRPDRRLAGVADLRPIGGLPWIACTEYAETLRAPVPLCVLLAAWAAEVLRRPPVMDWLARGRTPMAENLLRHW